MLNTTITREAFKNPSAQGEQIKPKSLKTEASIVLKAPSNSNVQPSLSVSALDLCGRTERGRGRHAPLVLYGCSDEC